MIFAHTKGFDFDVVYEVMHGAVEGIFVLEDNPATSLSDLKGTTVGIVGESDRGLLAFSAWPCRACRRRRHHRRHGRECTACLQTHSPAARSRVLVGAISDFVAIKSQGINVKNLLPSEMSEQPANNFSIRADAIGGERDAHIQGFLRAWAKGSYAGLVDLDATRGIAMQVDPENWVDEELGTIFLEAAQGSASPGR